MIDLLFQTITLQRPRRLLVGGELARGEGEALARHPLGWGVRFE